MFVYLFINVTGLDLDRGGFSVTRSTPGPTKFLQKVCFFVFLTPLVTRRHIYASKKGKKFLYTWLYPNFIHNLQR